MHLDLRLDHGILIVDMVNPPVNCLSLALRRDLYETFTVSAMDPRVSAVVVSGSGKYFCAGGDLREFGTEFAAAAPRLSADILPAIERCPKPVIAAIHGGAIGGGFELALACHYRVALDSARIALPEIKHGLIPLSGTIRLPRLWGVSSALAMILNAAALSAADFRGSAVFDCLVSCAADSADAQRACLQDAVLTFAHEHVLPHGAMGAHVERLVRNRPSADASPREALDTALLRHATHPLSAAQRAAIAAVRAGVEHADFDAALREAQRLYDAMAASFQSG